MPALRLCALQYSYHYSREASESYGNFCDRTKVFFPNHSLLTNLPKLEA